MNQSLNSFLEKTSTTVKKYIPGRALRMALFGLAGVLILLFVFQAGMMVGFRKATFDRSWDEHYIQNFGPRGKHMGPIGPMPGQFPNAHGTIGTIISVSLPTLIVEGPDKTEKVILVSDDTHIREMRNDLTAKDLAPDQTIVVIGEPNAQGQINAKFIRVLPAVPPVPTN